MRLTLGALTLSVASAAFYTPHLDEQQALFDEYKRSFTKDYGRSQLGTSTTTSTTPPTHHSTIHPSDPPPRHPGTHSLLYPTTRRHNCIGSPRVRHLRGESQAD